MHTPTRILVPVDFSPCSATALDYAATLGNRLFATLDVLHVWQAPGPLQPIESLPPLATFAHTQAGQSMKQFLAELEDRGLSSERVHGRLACGDPAQSILDVAESGQYDLLIMGRHGRGRLSHLFMGSVAEKVARRAVVPVLTLHRPPADQDPLAWTHEEVRP